MTEVASSNPVAVSLADRLNPLAGPSGPLQVRALFGAYGPSLMPRAGWHQGMAAGLSLLAAQVVGNSVDKAIERVVPASAPFAARMAVRGLVAGVGLAVAQLPESDDEPTARASVRTSGRLAAVAAVGGIIHEAAAGVREGRPPRSVVRPLTVAAASLAGVLTHSRRLLEHREEIVERWSDEDEVATLPTSLGIGLATVVAGNGVGAAFRATRRGALDFFGPGVAHTSIARATNAAAWGVGSAALYLAGVAAIARTNEKVEPAYSDPPDHDYSSGGPASISPFGELGLQGRRFATDVVTPDMIESVMGEPALAHPIRAYVGVNSEPVYPSGRSEMMMQELERLGAFERSHLLLVSPTGTGWVDQTMIEAAEFLTRGDISTACIQYARGPSFLEVQKVHLGRAQFRGLLWGVKMRLAGMPPEQRPRVLVFGESLGAWSSSDVVMHQGIAGFDHYGIDRALWFGLPGLAKWSKTGMRQGSGDLVPEGTVAAFDHFGQYDQLDEEQRDRLRAVVVDHDNDPIAQVSVRWAVKQPPWLRGEDRGRGVAESMDWMPLITFLQVSVDAMNAMRVVPGQFKSFGHDYRADTVDFVHAAYRLPEVSQEQKEDILASLLQQEIDRGQRIKGGQDPTAGQAPADVQ